MNIKEITKEFNEDTPDIIIALNNKDEDSFRGRIFGRGCQKKGNDLITNFALNWLREQIEDQLPF